MLEGRVCGWNDGWVEEIQILLTGSWDELGKGDDPKVEGGVIYQEDSASLEEGMQEFGVGVLCGRHSCKMPRVWVDV